MNNGNGKTFLLCGVILSVVFAVSVYTTFTKVENLVPVVVATGNIQAHEKITSKMVKIEEVPAMGRPANAIDDIEMVVDGWATTRIFQGQAIIQPMVSKQFDKSGASGLALSIPSEKLRAVSFPATPETAVGGKIQKGDFVDVIAVMDGAALNSTTSITKTILQQVEVFDVVGEGEKITGITLLLDLDQAELMAHAGKIGQIYYALDPGNNSIIRTTGTTNRSICERFGYNCSPN